jgi:potassium-dependent mechanosensitive channel
MHLEDVLRFGIVLTAAGLGHWALRRVGRRLPRVLARRRAAVGGSGPHWVRVLGPLFLVAKVGLWVGVGIWVTDRVMVLRDGRQLLESLVVTRLTAPLVTSNGHAYSALDLLAIPALFVALWLAASMLARLLQALVWTPAGVDRGVQETVAILTRYVLMFLGGIAILQARGIDVTSLTILASLLGVGIGFGLQNIANNFVSGLVIGLERPIQPGHFVRVGEFSGTVERIGARSTVIRTLDRVTILVPNSRLLESEVVNWSHGDPISRLHLPVSVAYGSPIARVRAALLESAAGHPGVLEDPRPRVQFLRFGDSALELELLVWTRDPERQSQLQSDLNYRIEAGLRRHRLQVPFPQRDLHLRSPALDGLVAALRRRVLSPEELAAEAAAAASAEEAEAFGGDLATGAVADLDAVAARMRAPDGVPILDRRHLLTVYPRCFVGREAVDWLVRSEGLSRAEAVMLGRLMVERGIAHHVLDEHDFEDGTYFYRFAADDASARHQGA